MRKGLPWVQIATFDSFIDSRREVYVRFESRFNWGFGSMLANYRRLWQKISVKLSDAEG
jgi:hypothetical protein